MRALLTALSMMTVVPVPETWQSPIDRGTAGRIVAAVPITGAVVGIVVSAVAWLSGVAGLPTLVVGGVGVAALALLTRGMHLDGFADCVDALGSYRSPDRAREIMRQGTIGPFGAAALTLLVLVEAAAVGALADRGHAMAIVVAIGSARVAAVIGCRRGWRAANTDGFGALTAGTQGLRTQVGWLAFAAAAAVLAVPGAPWQGPAAVLAGVGVAAIVMWHCSRRFAGVSGDVYGFGIEVATVIALTGMLVG